MAGVFKAEEKADNKFMIGFNEDLYEIIKKNTDFEKISSYNIIPARVLGVTYAEFLRWARDNYKGTIVGKGKKYPYIIFDDRANCNKCCMFLTCRLNGLM